MQRNATRALIVSHLKKVAKQAWLQRSRYFIATQRYATSSEIVKVKPHNHVPSGKSKLGSNACLFLLLSLSLYPHPISITRFSSTTLLTHGIRSAVNHPCKLPCIPAVSRCRIKKSSISFRSSRFASLALRASSAALGSSYLTGLGALEDEDEGIEGGDGCEGRRC
jgi:hypothetical protein